tara:strand:- start:10756 stop:11298 length:543 start_codon:yes stop_codon:yes gene_type:complete
MRSSDISLSIFIIICFVGLYLFNILAVGIKKIQNNWPEYRCNPMVMPFASTFGHSVGSNFTYCVQSIQGNMMGSFLLPLNYIMKVANTSMSGLAGSVNQLRVFINKLRNMITDVIKSVFGIFLNILIAFQQMLIKTKDTMGKMVGIMATLMYLLQGSIMTAQSTWNGPPGGLIRTVGKLG